jgi:transposase
VVWLAGGHTDMLRGMNSLALPVQEVLKRDPHAGDLYAFRGRTRKAPRRDLPLMKVKPRKLN